MHNLSHIIRKHNRFELKYLITLQQAEKFKSALSAYLIPDEHGSAEGSYPVTSLYYDSPDLRCYWEKVDGIKFRRKLRIRHYETSENVNKEMPVFIEIKQRMDRVIQKRRVKLPFEQALQICNNREMLDNFPEGIGVIREVHAFLWQYNLKPVIIVRYNRFALIGTEYDIGLRVTFDTSLAAQINPIDLHLAPSDFPILRPDWVVMEIKINERIPYWLTELVAVHNLRLFRFSKYCRSIEATNVNAFRSTNTTISVV